MFIAKAAKNPNAAKLWLDYILSKRGQTHHRQRGRAVRDPHRRRGRDTRRPALDQGARSANVKPIPVSAELARLPRSDEAPRLPQQWKATLAAGSSRQSTGRAMRTSKRAWPRPPHRPRASRLIAVVAVTVLAVFAAVADLLPELPHRAVLRRRARPRLRRLSSSSSPTPISGRRRKNSLLIAGRHGADRRAAGRDAGVPDGAHRPARASAGSSRCCWCRSSCRRWCCVRLRGGAGPVGFYSVWAKELFGGVPWNIYSLTSDRDHRRPHPRAARLPLLVGGAEEPGLGRRGGGAHGRRLAVAGGARREPADGACRRCCSPGVLVFFLGFELFGLPLVLGDPEGHLVLATYLYKLTNKLGTPSYHLMAAVAVCIVAVTLPLVLLQRWLLQERAASTSPSRARPAASGRCRSGAGAGSRRRSIGAVAVRHRRRAAVGHRAALVRRELGRGRRPGRSADARALPSVFGAADAGARRSSNTVLIGVVGGALAVACYTAIGFATHRQPRRLVALRRLPGAGAARRARAARRPGVPVGVPVLPAADAAAHRRSSACGSPTPWSGSPTACG